MRASGPMLIAIARAADSRTWALLAVLSVSCGSSDPGPPEEPRPATLDIQPDSVALQQIDSVPIAVTVLDQHGVAMSGQTVTYASLDPQLVHVSSAGVVKSVGVPGLGAIRVTSGQLTSDIPVSVARTPARVVVSPGSLRLFPGESHVLTATLLDVTGARILGALFTYTITGSGIGVDPGGLVSAGGVPATATITVSSQGVSETVPVAVPTHPAGTMTTVDLSGSSWGVAVSGKGVMYHTQSNTGDPALFHTTLPLQTPSRWVSGMVGSSPLSVAVTSSGAKVVVPGFRGPTVSIVEAETGNVTTVAAGLGGALLVAGIGADDSLAWIGSDLDRLYVVDIGRDSVIDTVPVFGWCNALVFSRNQPLLYASLYNGGRVAEINTVTRTVVRTLQVGGNPQGIDVSPDGTELYIASEDSSVIKIWDLQADVLLTAIPLGGAPFGLALSPDGTQIWVTRTGNSQNSRLEVYDRASRAHLTGFDMGPGTPRRIAFNLSGTTAVISDDGFRIHFVN